MIERTTIDGRQATVTYLKRDLTPVEQREDAELIKVLFDDGEVVFAVPEKEQGK